MTPNDNSSDKTASEDATVGGPTTDASKSAQAAVHASRHATDSSTSGAALTPSASNANEASPPTGQAAPAAVVSAAPTGPKARLGGWTWLARVGLKSAMLVVVGALLLFMLGLAQRFEWISANGSAPANGGQTSAAAAGGSEGKRYICPMMCTPPSTQPGRCPVCAMELVEAAAESSGDGISVTLEASARRLVGIQTAVSQLSSMTRTIRTIGSIDFDESRLATISAYVDGRLEKLYVNYVGVQVSAGDDLALIYSPQLYSAQTEYVTSLDGRSSSRFSVGGSEMQEMARENLSELGMTQEQIAALSESRAPQSRIRIKSPQSGTVIVKSAVEGDYVKTGQKMLQIADLTTVWLMLDLFPDDASRVRFGQQVEAEIQSMPGEVFTGRVAFIDPTVNPRTRTVRVRVEMLNFDGRLRPGDYATARISVPAIPTKLVYDPALSGKYISPMHPQVIRDEPGTCPICDMPLISTSELGFAADPQPQQRVVTVPRDAVLMTGEHGVIYVETEPGLFEIRRVIVGPMNDTEAVIVDGLAAGEMVALNGNFLIDSQMQLAGNPSLMDPSRAPSYPPGPLQLPDPNPVRLTGEVGDTFDQAFEAYFAIQRAMAADLTPPPTALNQLLAASHKLEVAAEVPDAAQLQIAAARRAAARMDGSLESARKAYRTVSHSLLRAAMEARGPRTAQELLHLYCPMVPGGGGDWLQPGGEIANPYWGAEMLRCGEVVRDLGVEKPDATADENRVSIAQPQEDLQ